MLAGEVPPARTGRTGLVGLVAAAVVVVDLASVGVVLPLLPPLGVELDLAWRALGLVVGVAAGAAVVAAPRWDRLAGLVGLRLALVTSLLGTAAGSALTGLADGPGLFVLGRLLAGLSCATAALAVAACGGRRAGPALAAGLVGGPLLAALAGPAPLAAPFLALAAASLVLAVVGWLVLPDVAPPGPPRGRPPAPPPMAAEDRWRLQGAALLGLTAAAGSATTLALFVDERFETGPGGAGFLLAAVGVAIVATQRWLGGRRLATGALRIGLVVLAAGLAVVALAPVWAVAAAGLLVAGGGQGLLGLAVVGAVPPDAHDGAGRARFGPAGLAAVAGPVIGARLFDLMGAAAPFLAGAVVALVAVLLVPRRGFRAPAGG